MLFFIIFAVLNSSANFVIYYSMGTKESFDKLFRFLLIFLFFNLQNAKIMLITKHFYKYLVRLEKLFGLTVQAGAEKNSVSSLEDSL